MIFSSIHEDISCYPKAIQRAVEYLRQNDFEKMDTGVYEIDGKEMYAQVFDVMTGDICEKRPEVHENFIDVQFLVSGEEKLGFTIDTGDYDIDEQIKERDIIFYKNIKNEGFVRAFPQCFCVFFPFDIHRPAVACDKPMKIRKVVIKIHKKLLT